MTSDEKRTKMLHIYTPKGGAYRIEIERETLRTYDNGDVLPLPSGGRVVNVALPAIAAKPLPGGPITISTYSDLRALISLCATDLAEKDEQAEAARIAAIDPNEP